MSPPATLIKVPTLVRAGEVIEIAATIAHPMDSGYKPGADGQLIARNILRRFTCHCDGVLVCEITFYPAIASNPWVRFHLRASHSAPLVLQWLGDQGFSHTETVALKLA